jgi:hypothetical protein
MKFRVALIVVVLSVHLFTLSKKQLEMMEKQKEIIKK